MFKNPTRTLDLKIILGVSLRLTCLFELLMDKNILIRDRAKVQVCERRKVVTDCVEGEPVRYEVNKCL